MHGEHSGIEARAPKQSTSHRKLNRFRAARALALCFFVSACSATRPDQGAWMEDAVAHAPSTDSQPARHPGARTYAGAYSCDGCLQRTITLTVFADGSYRLREVPTRGDPVLEQGRWHVPPQAADRLVLESAGGNESAGGTRVFRRAAPDALILVDPEGRELRGLVGGVLARLPAVDPIPASRQRVGLYGRRDGRRVLVDCESGSTLRMIAGAPGSAQAALDAAWTALAPLYNETVLVVVHAHEVAPEGGVASGAAPALVIDAFERATRDGRCAGTPSNR